MSRRRGFTFSKVSLRPPTITESLPSCSVITLPATGESTMSAPFSRTLAATSLLYAGLTVLISTPIFPGVTAASIPSGPFITAPSAAEFVTIENTKSDDAATARGESAHFIPFLTSHSAFERVRLYPVTPCPFPSSLFTISLPITPSPTKPKFAMNSSSPANHSKLEPATDTRDKRPNPKRMSHHQVLLEHFLLLLKTKNRELPTLPSPNH